MQQKGPWSGEQIRRFLRESRIPVRIACNGASGHPVLASLWFLPEDGRIWCATQRGASIVGLLERDPRCAFEVSVEAPPYCGVRGTALARMHDERGEQVLRALIERYLGDSNAPLASFLLRRVEQETAICIEPKTLVSWDYGDRMEPIS